MGSLSEYERGVLIGLLVGEGSFGGDGKQPQIVMRLHVRHERVVRWLHARFPATRLYGPYHHGDRHYYQWMARGRALVHEVLPELDVGELARIDDHAAERLSAMCSDYADFIATQRRRSAPASTPDPGPHLPTP